MSEQDKIQLFENQPIRAAWDSEQEEWYFSIVDVIKVLTGSPNPQTYWRVMKKRLKDEGNETVTNCNGLKMVAADGKRRMTDVATTEQLLRLIQSIPSPKAEPFKRKRKIPPRLYKRTAELSRFTSPRTALLRRRTSSRGWSPSCGTRWSGRFFICPGHPSRS